MYQSVTVLLPSDIFATSITDPQPIMDNLCLAIDNTKDKSVWVDKLKDTR